MLQRLSAAFTCLALMSGACSTATLERVGAPPIEARIAASDQKHVYVLGDDGQVYKVPRATIRDIDHPGNVLMAVGGGFLVPALILFLSSLAQDNRSDRDVLRAMSGTYFVFGAPLFLGGIIPYTQSVRAAAEFSPQGEALEREAMPVPLEATAPSAPGESVPTP